MNSFVRASGTGLAAAGTGLAAAGPGLAAAALTAALIGPGGLALAAFSSELALPSSSSSSSEGVAAAALTVAGLAALIGGLAWAAFVVVVVYCWARDRRIRLDPPAVAVEDKAEHIDGVKEWCPLAILAFFCVIWDFVPDMMHMVYNLLKTYLVATMKGTRKPKVPRLLKISGYEGDQLRERKDQNRRTLDVFKHAQKVLHISSFNL